MDARPHPPDPPSDDPSTSDPSPGDLFDAGPLPRLRAMLHCPVEARRVALRRACVAAALAWLPLLALSALQEAAGPAPRHGFLHDISAHARFLLGIPLLIGAEAWCLPQLAAIVRHFTSGGLIADADRPRWQALLASCRRMLDGRGVEVVLMVVSQPLFLLCVLGWGWRVLVWTRLLWGASRLQLRLVPSHPDLAGGLRFLSVSLRAFAPVALSIGTVIAGTRAGEILGHAAPAPELGDTGTMVLSVLISLVLFAGPLLVFAWPLHRARLRGVIEYGALAGAVGRRFEERWIRPVDTIHAGALEAQDFSATTDLYSVAANVRSLVLVPVGVRDLLMLALWSLLPFLPLVFLKMPLSALLERIAELLL